MSDPAHRMMFLNLPVSNLQASIRFFEHLGFTFDEKFTDQSATCMIVSDKCFVMLLQNDRFEDFTTKDLADATKSTEAIICVSAPDRDGVDAFASAALEAGGKPANDPIDMGFMYGRSFDDLDGHHWEVMWMNPEAMETGPAELAEQPA